MVAGRAEDRGPATTRFFTGPGMSMLRAAGLLTGVAMAVLLLFAVRVPSSSGALGAGLRLTAVPPGDLTVSTDPVLVARDLVAGGRAAQGRLRLRNISAGPVSARIRLRPADRSLDHGLNVRLQAGDRVLAAGPLGSLRRWSRAVAIDDGVTVHARVQDRKSVV